MKRILAIGCLVCLLAGCSSNIVSTGDIENTLAEAEQLPSYKANHFKKYYSYYLEPCIGRLQADSTSNIFCYNGIKFVMNLNVAKILQDVYYSEGESRESTLSALKDAEYSVQGTFEDSTSTTQNFEVEVGEVGSKYVLYMYAGNVEFFSVVNSNEITEIAEKMLCMAKTVNVSTERVKSDFSLRKDITYTAKKVQLFQSIVPEEGSIDELFEKEDNSLQEPSASEGNSNSN